MERVSLNKSRVVVLFVAVSSAVTLAQQGPWPHPLDVRDFGTFGPQNVSNAPMLTAAEEQALAQAVARMPKFAPYYFSGCHDRAHAALLLLPEALRSKVSKIWVIGPARLTAAIPGTIRLRASDGEKRQVDWGYHVALMADTPGGAMVFDPVLSPGGLINREQWLGSFVAPPLSVWLVSSASVYVFNFSALNPPARNGGEVWNGNANTYEGLLPAYRHLPENLARDEIGVEALGERTCPEIAQYARAPEALSSFLDAGKGSSACEPAFVRYRQRTAAWKAALKL